MPEEFSADNIRAHSATEAIRKRPQLYFETCFRDETLDFLPFAAACHAFDEYFDGNCTQLAITLSGNHFALQYDAGMSLKDHSGVPMAELLLTELFACSNHKKHLAVGDEFCEIGLAAINAAASVCTLRTTWQGQQGYFRFEEGKAVARSIVPGSPETASTEIVLHPDPAVFGDLKLTVEGVQQKAEALMERLPGWTITVTAEELPQTDFD